ncbi:MAG: TIGR03643 family protein [Pirellulaceae bacterium]
MAKHTPQSLSIGDVDRVFQMAWEDRTSFDAIKRQFGLSPGEVIELMRTELKPSSFRLWRERTAGRATKHVAKRGFEIGRFRCPDQRGS